MRATSTINLPGPTWRGDRHERNNGGNELPKLLPQVTVVKLLDVTESEILNVLGENEHGIAVAKGGVHRSFLRARRWEAIRSYINGVVSSMDKQIMNIPEKHTQLSSAAGFSVVEMLAVIAVVGILSTIGFTSFQRSNRSFKVAGATRTLSTYLEKARVDAVRRRGGTTVVFDSATSYTVNLDFNGDGIITARTIALPPGTSLRYTLPPATTSIDPSSTPRTIQYNWRGQTTSASNVLFTLTDSNTGVVSSTVVVGPAGNVSTGTTVVGPVTTPTPQNTTVTTTTAIKSMR